MAKSSKPYETFYVDTIDDWVAVADYLLTKAVKDPLSESDSENASETEAESLRRAMRAVREGRSRELTKYSAVVVYKRFIRISLIATAEPDSIRLSMTGIMPSQTMESVMFRLNDRLAREITESILGPEYEERVEGGLKRVVRNFYLR